MSEEVWAPVAGYQGRYSVSNLGRVRSEKIIGSQDNRGYTQVALCSTDTSEYRFCQVGILVLEAFVGPNPGGMDACHNDGNPRNNTPANLRWDTRKGNLADRHKHGTMKPSTKLCAEQVLAIRASGKSITEIASEFGVTKQNVSQIRQRKTWNHI